MYKVGNRVTYALSTYKARIVEIHPDEYYTVEFDDKDLIPPKMKVPGAYLEIIIDENTCPLCQTPWTETVIGKNTFYDCLKCNLKREDA